MLSMVWVVACQPEPSSEGGGPTHSEDSGDLPVEDTICEDCPACVADADDDGARAASGTTPSADEDCDDAFEGQPTDPLDCDDQDASVFPGAAESIGDGLDSDCDGSDGPSTSAGSLPSLLSPVQVQQTEFGASVAMGDVDGDGHDEILVGCEDVAPQFGDTRGGHGWLLDGPALEITAEWHGDPQDPFDTSGPLISLLGQRVAIADLSGGDGQPELILRSDHSIYLLRAPWPPPYLGDDGVLPHPLVVRVTGREEVTLGTRILAGELTGDSAPDLAVECSVDLAADVWGVCVLPGPLEADLDVAEAALRIVGDSVGTTLAASDLDGDGQPDLVVGGDSVAAIAGVVHLFRGPLALGELSTDDADASFYGEQPGDWLGQEATDAGDLDGDGRAEVAASAMGWPAHERQGRVYLLDFDTVFVEGASLTVDGDPGLQHLGRGMAGADLDGDGQDDLVLGAPSLEGELPGRIALFYGPLAGHFSAAEAHRAWHGSEPGEEFGSAMATGDVDGDGFLDLVVGASRNDQAAIDAGKIYLLRGPL